MPISLTSGEDEGLRPALKPWVMEKYLGLKNQSDIRLKNQLDCDLKHREHRLRA